MTRGLVLDQLTVHKGAQMIVSLNATVNPGQVLTIMGPSGSGKSTVLAAIIGTLDRGFGLSGQIRLDGVNVTALPTHARRIGILFQDDVLFGHLSVGSNLGFALPVKTTDRRNHIDAALASVGLDGFADRDPATLSGGQRARVALLRTLLAQPRALLLDEPFSRLDTALRAQVRGLVLDRARSEGLPVILVTHDHDDARAAEGPVLSPLGAPINL